MSCLVNTVASDYGRDSPRVDWECGGAVRCQRLPVYWTAGWERGGAAPQKQLRVIRKLPVEWTEGSERGGAVPQNQLQVMAVTDQPRPRTMQLVDALGP